MKRTIMTALVAGVLLLSAASVAMFANPMDGGTPEQPGVMHEPSGETGSEAVGARGDVSGSESVGAVIAGRKPGVGSRSGGDVLSSDPCPPLDCPPPAEKLAGGKGGISGDCWVGCGGETLGADAVLAGGWGGIFGDTVIVGTKPGLGASSDSGMLAGGRGGIGGDCNW